MRPLHAEPWSPTLATVVYDTAGDPKVIVSLAGLNGTVTHEPYNLTECFTTDATRVSCHTLVTTGRALVCDCLWGNPPGGDRLWSLFKCVQRGNVSRLAATHHFCFPDSVLLPADTNWSRCPGFVVPQCLPSLAMVECLRISPVLRCLRHHESVER